MQGEMNEDVMELAIEKMRYFMNKNIEQAKLNF